MSGQGEELKIKIILASASPRRKKIFENLGFDFEVLFPQEHVEERYGNPISVAVKNSIEKARSVFSRCRSGEGRYLICSFDTVVCYKNQIFGKPSNLEQAYRFISVLSGRIHRVVSGVCIMDGETGRFESGSEVTEVRFRKLDREEIDYYISLENVLDKAGAYNIDGAGALLVERINGCFFNVMGVPVFRFIEILRKFDFKILERSKE
jgi:septum formation protein